jgi:hypothetical protein
VLQLTVGIGRARMNQRLELGHSAAELKI